MDIAFRFDPEILIGVDTLSMAGTICKRHGKKVFIAADQSLDPALINRLKGILKDSGVDSIVFPAIEENSGVDASNSIVELSVTSYCDAIIGFGGYRTQQIARMAAIMAPLRLTAFELLDGTDNEGKSLPFISIPVKGLDPFSLSEYFIVPDPRTRLIKSIKSPPKLYSAVLIDNSLYTFLKSVNGASFIFSGFSSAVEAFCSSKANFLSDSLLERAISFYAQLFKGTGDKDLVTDTFIQANFLTALGCSASSPGAGSALSAAISARFSVTKEQCASALLPYIAEKLVSARPEKMARVAEILGAEKTGSTADAAASSIEIIKNCMEPMGLSPSLKEFNLSIDKVVTAAEEARQLDFISNSPWIVSEDEVFNLIKKVI